MCISMCAKMKDGFFWEFLSKLVNNNFLVLLQFLNTSWVLVFLFYKALGKRNVGFATKYFQFLMKANIIKDLYIQ